MDMTMGMEMGKEIDPEDIAFRITSHESWVSPHAQAHLRPFSLFFIHPKDERLLT